jgi:hypothetical protein
MISVFIDAVRARGFDTDYEIYDLHPTSEFTAHADTGTPHYDFV